MSELTSVGTCSVQVKEAFVTDKPIYPGSIFEVCIVVEDAEKNSAHWIGAFSNNYGKGTFSDRTQTQITLQKLTELGLKDNDIENLNSLVGVMTSATTKASQCGKYINISYLGGGGNKPTAMAKNKVSELAAQIKSANIQTVQAEVVAPENPFLA